MQIAVTYPISPQIKSQNGYFDPYSEIKKVKKRAGKIIHCPNLAPSQYASAKLVKIERNIRCFLIRSGMTFVVANVNKNALKSDSIIVIIIYIIPLL